MEFDFKKVSKVFKAFCDENRVKIINELMSGEKCGCDLLDKLNISQPTLSHHMKILCDSNMVDCYKEGKWTYYKISKEGVLYALEYINYINRFD